MSDPLDLDALRELEEAARGWGEPMMGSGERIWTDESLAEWARTASPDVVLALVAEAREARRLREELARASIQAFLEGHPLEFRGTCKHHPGCFQDCPANCNCCTRPAP